jgi:hypothetical protein
VEAAGVCGSTCTCGAATIHARRCPSSWATRGWGGYWPAPALATTWTAACWPPATVCSGSAA